MLNKIAPILESNFDPEDDYDELHNCYVELIDLMEEEGHDDFKDCIGLSTILDGVLSGKYPELFE